MVICRATLSAVSGRRTGDLVRVDRGHRVIRTLAIHGRRAVEDRVAERLAVALEPDHLPACEALVAAVLRRAEAALERVADHDVVEGLPPRIRRVPFHLLEDVVLIGGRELHEDVAVLLPRHLVDHGETRPVDVAQPHERRAAVLPVERRDLGHGGGAEELGAPDEPLQPGHGEEHAEAVVRPPMAGNAVIVVGVRIAVAERPAGEDVSSALVERGQQRLEVVHDPEVGRAGIGVPRNDPVGVSRERRPLVPREEAPAQARPRPTRLRYR